MKNVKSYLWGLLIFSFLFSSCSREDEILNSEQEKATLSFKPMLLDLTKQNATGKQEAGDLPECSDDTPAYVMLILSNDEGPVVGAEGEAFRIDLVEGQDFTEEVPELELDPGTYSLDHFAVYSASETLIWLAPLNGFMGDFLDNPLPLEINLGAGAKKYADVSVVCFDDRMVNEYGYLFYDLEGVEAIEFCLFGNYCDESGRHYPAAFSVDVWAYNDGEQGAQIYADQRNEVTLDANEDYAGSNVCLALPDTEGADEYYFEITLLNSDAYGEVTEEVIRSGVVTDEEVRSLFEGEDAVDFYHFREGTCNLGDTPDILGEDDGNGGTTDADEDGIADAEDNCPELANPDQADADEDGVGDACEETAIEDTDEDGIADAEDNCPEVANPDQADADEDGVGDACEEAPIEDADEDGIADAEDNCPEVSNPDQEDADGDGVGDACEEAPIEDADEDGIADAEDNCSEVSNPDQTDADGDGVGDACEEAPIEDADEDGIADAEDNCPEVANPDQTDADGDGVGDACEEAPIEDADEDGIADAEDNCPEVSNPDQEDADGDGVGDACEEDPIEDADGDGIADAEDNCPEISNPDQADANGDGIGDTCDEADPTGDDGQLINGANHTGDIQLGDLDTWTLTVEAGDFIHLSMARTSGDLNPEFRLLSPTGDVLGRGWTYGESTQVIVPDAPVSGTYRVIAGDYQANSTGEYVLRLAQAPPIFEVPSGDEGGALTNGGNHSGNISLGDLDQWSFTANEGVFIQITVAQTSGEVNPEFRLVSPSGEVVGRGWTYGDSAQLVVQDAPESGSYRLIVGDYQVNSSGEYILTATW